MFFAPHSLWEIERDVVCVSLSSVFLFFLTLYIELLVFSSTFILIAYSVLYLCSNRIFFLPLSVLLISCLRNSSEGNKVEKCLNTTQVLVFYK